MLGGQGILLRDIILYAHRFDVPLYVFFANGIWPL